MGASEIDRRAIFDVYCKNAKGESFIVELQKAKQKYFKDRSIFYSTFPIQEKSERGEWNFKLKAVYTIGILNEAFFEAAEIAGFSEDERFKYEKSLKYYRDMNNVIETAKEEGYEEGREEAMQQATQVIRMTEAKLEEERNQKEDAQKREEEALAEVARLRKMLNETR